MAALMAVIGPLGFAMRGSSWMAGSAPCRLSGLAMASGSKELEEDAESNARLMAALGISEDAAIDLIYEEPDGVKEKSKDIPSHQQLDLDESGQPLQLRFAYVDEASCIGCTYCADVARNTFYMNEQAGRARVYAQGQDSPEVLLEAMESCPVNCISFVDHEDLVILESEREGHVINPMSMGIPATWSARMNGVPPTKAKLGGGTSLQCCNNCPGRGCKECPMYGVGLNPIYIARMEERAAKKEASGKADDERAEADRAASVAAINAEESRGVVVPTEDEENSILASEGPSEDVFAVLYTNDPYGIGDESNDDPLLSEPTPTAEMARPTEWARAEEQRALGARKAEEERQRIEAEEEVRRKEEARRRQVALEAAENELVADAKGAQGPRDVPKLTAAIELALARGVGGKVLTDAQAKLGTMETEFAREKAEIPLAMALRRAVMSKGSKAELMGLEQKIGEAETSGIVDATKVSVAREVFESGATQLPCQDERWWLESYTLM